MGTKNAFLRNLRVPVAAPSGRTRVSSVHVDVANLLPAFRKRKLFAQVERVLHLTGRVVLRLVECIKVPECVLDNRAVELGESHLKEKVADFI